MMRRLRLSPGRFVLALFATLASCSGPAEEPVVDRFETLPVPIESLPGTSETKSVDYYNPKTGYSATYDLDVDVDSDGKVERINFDNGGYEDDIVDQEDNDDGSVTVTDEDGREFTVESEE